MQCPHHLVLVKPRDFAFNAQTAASNAFQQPKTIDHYQQLGASEFDAVVRLLEHHGIACTVFDSPAGVQVPDAVFPNNWFAVMPSGELILFPMLAPNRRDEINPALVSTIERNFQITRHIDLSPKANENIFLEGTGSIVFDHDKRLAYACESPRTNIALLESLCSNIGYTPVSFSATDPAGQPVYHTNVVMSVGARTVVCCLESVTDAIERAMLRERILQSGKTLLEISYAQMKNFCGNLLEVLTQEETPVWLCSGTAWQALDAAQQQALQNVAVVDIPTIETLGGGSLRCMLAGIHAPALSR